MCETSAAFALLHQFTWMFEACYVCFFVQGITEQKASDFNHKRTKPDDTQPKLNVVWFVVRPCLPDTDFVVSSNYRLIGTPGKPFRCFYLDVFSLYVSTQ